MTHFGCHLYPFEEFLVRAICCCSSRRAMSPFILEVPTELSMDLKSRWSSSVAHKHSDSNFVHQYFSRRLAFLFSFKIKFTFASFSSSPIREFLVFMILSLFWTKVLSDMHTPHRSPPGMAPLDSICVANMLLTSRF